MAGIYYSFKTHRLFDFVCTQLHARVKLWSLAEKLYELHGDFWNPNIYYCGCLDVKLCLIQSKKSQLRFKKIWFQILEVHAILAPLFPVSGKGFLLRDNNIVSGFSQHNNILFYFYLDNYMFRSLDRHQAFFTKRRIR